MVSILNKRYIRDGLEIEAEKAGLSAEQAQTFIDDVIELLGEPTPRPSPDFFKLRKCIHDRMSSTRLDYDSALESLLNNPNLFVRHYQESQNKLSAFGWFYRAPETDGIATDTKLTWDTIEQSARAKLAATGQRMKQGGGLIEHGPLKGAMTENALHLAIRDGYHGLQKGLFKGLGDFQDQCGIPHTTASKGYTRGDIIRLSDVAIALRMTHLIEGHRLTKNDGIVKYGPLAGEKCVLIDEAFKRGNRGLKDCGFDGISAYADHLGIPRDPHHASSLVSRTKKMRFNLEDAEESFRLHIEHDGKIPIADNTPVTFGPLAKLNISFAAVNASIGRQKDIHGYGGMKDLIEDRCGEVAFWHAPESKLARKFAQQVGIDYDFAGKVASLDLAAFFVGPVSPHKRDAANQRAYHAEAPAASHAMK